jgi:hypothetical protein
MSRLAVAMAVWIAFVFVAWNVLYDRYVAVSAVQFTREQILHHQRGEPVVPIHVGFSPQVGDAARRASLWMSPVVAIGTCAIYFTFRRTR